MRHEVVPCTLAHLRYLARHLRDGDAAELRGAGLEPRHALIRLWRLSHDPRTLLIDGEVAACGGDTSILLSDVGNLWLFTTAAVERAPLAYFREARREIADRLRGRARLIVDVGCGYQSAIWFLRLLGFDVSSEPSGTNLRATIRC